MNGRTIMLAGFTLAWCVSIIAYAVTHKGDVPSEMWALYGTGVGAIWTLTKDEPTDTYTGRHRKNDS